MSGVEEGVLVHCADAFQYGPTSVSSAGTQPALLQPLLSPIFISTVYIFKSSSISFSLWHIYTQTSPKLCECVRGFSRPRGPGASPPIQCSSLHYPLYLSICPSVHHCLYPAAHLAVLLASLPHTASIAALLWVTFKDWAPPLINTETAALYSMSVLSFLPLLLLCLSLSLSKSKVLHLLMMEAVSSHLYYTGIYIQTKDNVRFAALPLSSCLSLTV